MTWSTAECTVVNYTTISDIELGKHDIAVAFFFFQAEDGIRDLVRSRGLGDVYKRQALLQRLSRSAHRPVSVRLA